MQLQEKNLGYKQAYRQAQLNAGSQTAQRRQAANQYNEEAYAAAHGARQQAMQMGMRNFLDYLNNYTSNEYKRRMGNGMLNLYDQQVKLDKDRTDAYIDALKNGNKGNNNSDANQPSNFAVDNSILNSFNPYKKLNTGPGYQLPFSLQYPYGFNINLNKPINNLKCGKP